MKAVVALLIQFPALGRCKDWVYASIPGDKAIRNDQLKTWEHYHDCGFGRRQSPVDVITKDVASASVLQGVLDPRIQRVPLLMVNTGHGFQLHETSPSHKELVLDTAGYVEAATGQSKGYTRIHDAKYNFYQAHWHTPSEHKIDGKHSIMEAHFVHQLDDSELQFNFSLVGSTHHLAVISVMYNLTEKCNADLELFWDSFPMTANNMAQVDAVVDLQEIMESALQGGYYMFDGSLTTPPCTEGVSWNLLKKPMTVCQRQIDALTAALATTQGGVPFNNRVTQPLNHRIVADTTGLAPSPPPPPSNPPGAKWYYANDNSGEADPIVQYDTWGQVAPLCNSGKEQSPIDIDTSKVVDMSLKPISSHFDATTEYVKNTGHGFQLYETHPFQHTLGAANTPEVVSGEDKGYSMIRDQRYNFYQVHWHTPSENTIDGKSFPLEAHFVHQFDDPLLHGTYHRLAVIGLMYELGECNEFLDKFWDEFPTNKGTSAYTGDPFDLSNKLTYELQQGYWHWYGSLTTPPCTESVSWNLLKKTETVCQRQVDKLQQALAQTQNGVSVNNRVVQPLNHRVVVGSSGSSSPAAPNTASPPPPSSSPAPEPTQLPAYTPTLQDLLNNDDDDDGASGIEITLLALALVITFGVFALIFMTYHLMSRGSNAAVALNVPQPPAPGGKSSTNNVSTV
mmetsp:Transcript_4354/g.8534  ORF Transcript_4354/g.8534 Transcript_4354/m.8534 type:complete len:679 (-) Transcript_4354:298-2334(-)